MIAILSETVQGQRLGRRIVSDTDEHLKIANLPRNLKRAFSG